MAFLCVMKTIICLYLRPAPDGMYIMAQLQDLSKKKECTTWRTLFYSSISTLFFMPLPDLVTVPGPVAS